MGPPSGGGPVTSGLGATATGSDAGQVTTGRGLPRIGEVFNGYTVVELLGQGNMGRIYRVRDQLGRDLALKVILGQVASAEGLARFEREGQAMAAIPRHKHVIGVHSAGTSGGLPYLVLDFVEGENLDEVLRRGPLPAAQAALVCEKLSRALDHVHQSGVLHRDLKPANVLIRAVDGEPLLTDFGLAGLQGADTLTRTGDVIGTPLYMAPEQLLGLHKEVDGRADVWSLGVMLFEMAAGALPFPGTTMLEVTDAVLGADPPRLHDRCPDADSGLTRIVNLALAKDKSERLPSPGALAAALRTWRKQRQGYEVELDLPPPPGRKARRKWLVPLVAAIAALVVLGIVGIVLSRLSLPTSASPTPGLSPAATAAASPGSLSAAAASAIEAVEAVDRSDRGYKDLEQALANPALKGLPHVGRVRLRAIGYTALQQITVELRQPKPRPQVLAGYLRAAGVAQRLSDYDLGGGSNVDGILTWLENRYPTDPSLVYDSAWVKVFGAIAESGFRPSQRISGKFLDTISLKPMERQSREYLEILRALVSVGTPTFYTQFDLKKEKPKKPHREAGDVALYVYYRTLICALDRAKASDREKDAARRELSRLVRTRPQSFEPRTLAMALNVSILPGQENIQPEIERLEKALQAAPDSFYGWDGLIHLYLDLAELRAQSRDDAGVRAAYQKAMDVVTRGRRALNIDAGGTRSPTEAIAIKVLLVRQVELLVTQDKDPTRAGNLLGDKDMNDAKRKGQDRRKRIRSWSRGR